MNRTWSIQNREDGVKESGEAEAHCIREDIGGDIRFYSSDVYFKT
jgi:hypothetical protein